MGELKQKAIKGVFWSAVDKGGVKAVSFFVSIILARILTPSDYGIIGMIMVFIIIANVLVDSGFSQALIQKKTCDPKDYSTTFYFNMLVGFFCYITLFLLAPYIAIFYDEPLLIPVLRVLGINIIFIALSAVQRAILLKELNFRQIATVDFSAVMASGCLGVYLAIHDFGVWALVGQQIASQMTMTIVYWVLCKWHPHLLWSRTSLKRLWSFGSKLLAANLVATIMREVYSLTIGKFYRPAELGFYTRAVQTSDMVAMTTNEVINAVTFPVLSSLQDNRERMLNVYGKMLGMTAFCIFPVMIFLAVVANPFVELLLTERWLPVVPLLQWLCMARMFTPISGLNMNILNSIGRSDLFLKVDLSKLPLTILTMIITIPLGVKAIVIGNFIWTVLCYFINAYLPGKIFGFGIKAQFTIFYKILIATVLSASFSFEVMTFCSGSLMKFIVGLFTAFCCYGAFSYFLKIPELKEVIFLFKSLADKLNH